MSEGSDDHGPRLLVMGRQGAGKGTQCALLAEQLGIPHISTGDVFRAAVAADTPLGREVEAILDNGELVPDELVNRVVTERLSADDAEAGFVLDGFPRTVAQADALFATMGDDVIDLAIEIRVPTDEVLRRLALRRVCDTCGRITIAPVPGAGPEPCGDCPGRLVQRSDDTEPAISRRLILSERKGGPLLIWLHSRDILASVDGQGTSDAVHERILGLVQRAVLQRAHAAS